MAKNKESTSDGENRSPSDECWKDYSKYAINAFKKMNDYRKNNQLCDVIFQVGDKQFPAHRIVLASSSDYFDAMFSIGMAESAQNIVELKSISPEVMEALLEFVYTGRVKVSMENVQDLLPAASLIQLEGIKDACSKFLFEEIDSSNVLGIYRFAEIHNCTDLETFAKNFTAHNFESVIENEEFSFLEPDELIDLISREDLNVHSEETVYNAIMKWVYQSPQTRSNHLPNLLRFIRLSVMSVHFLTDTVDQEPLIKKSLECRDIIDEAKKFHLRPDLRPEMRDSHFRQRDSGDEYLVVIGGFGSDQSPSDSVEMLNPRTKEWSELPNLPIKYRYVAACAMGTCIYVIGGFDGRERLDTVGVLDITQREGWRWLAPMHYKRGLSVACAHKGLIYVCGGFDGQTRLRSLEVYHSKIDEWRLLEEMITPREGAGLVVVDQNLYCLGGYDGYHLLNSMETYDLQTGTWSPCSPMYMRRSGAGCAVLGDAIYVCGGYGGAEGFGAFHLDSVEIYNTRVKQWTLATNLNVPRCYVGACSLAGKIYVAAGYNGVTLLDNVESFDPIENIWKLEENCRMNHERCDTGMCVVRFPSNVPLDFGNKSTTKKNSINNATNTAIATTTEAGSSTNTTAGQTQTINLPRQNETRNQPRPFQMNNGSLSAVPDNPSQTPISNLLRPTVTPFNHQIGSPSIVSNNSTTVSYPSNNSNQIRSGNGTQLTTLPSMPRVLYPSRISSTSNTNWPSDNEQTQQPESVRNTEPNNIIYRLIDRYIMNNQNIPEENPRNSRENKQKRLPTQPQMNNNTPLNNSLYEVRPNNNNTAPSRPSTSKTSSRNDAKLQLLLSLQDMRRCHGKNRKALREIISKGPSRPGPSSLAKTAEDFSNDEEADYESCSESHDSNNIKHSEDEDEDDVNEGDRRVDQINDKLYDMLLYSENEESLLESGGVGLERRRLRRQNKKDVLVVTDDDQEEGEEDVGNLGDRRRIDTESISTSSSSEDEDDDTDKEMRDDTTSNIINTTNNNSVQYSPSKIVLIKDSSTSGSGGPSANKKCNHTNLDSLIQPDVIGIAPLSTCNNASVMNNETPNSVNVNEIETCFRNEINHVVNNLNNISDSGITQPQVVPTANNNSLEDMIEQGDHSTTISPTSRAPASGCERDLPSLNLTFPITPRTNLENLQQSSQLHNDRIEEEGDETEGHRNPSLLENDEPRTDGEGQEEVHHANPDERPLNSNRDDSNR